MWNYKKLLFWRNRKVVTGSFAYKTDIGKVRLTNEDQASAVVNSKGHILLVVCDGMGGQNKGELASSIAVSHLIDDFKSTSHFIFNSFSVIWFLNRKIRAINSYINKESRTNPLYRGMGTTLTAMVIYHNKIITAQVGDSRAYQINAQDKLEQITTDQTYVGYLYRTGQITKEEMATHPRRHMLTNALGTYPSVEIDITTRPYYNQTILLCTDGVYNNVNDPGIEAVLKGGDSCEEKINQIIAVGNSNGGSDNMGLVLWEANYGN